jgi:predicted nuclease of predicted toxin-antitoxin system
VILWIDAQLSPALAPWITQEFGVEAYSMKRLNYRDASDQVIFQAAREAHAVVMTKDGDFPRLLNQYGPPPQVLWVTLGNTSNAHMREVLCQVLPRAFAMLESGEALVEISDIQ